MKELDASTIREQNITSLQLMERAAERAAEAIAMEWPAKGTPVVVFAGPGNNGGDGLAVARLLAGRGYAVKAYLFNTGDHLSNDCAENKKRILETEGVEFTEVTSQFEAPALTEEMLVVDALFGTGLDRPATGGFATLIKFINAAPAQVVAIDMPSGLMSEDNAQNIPSNIIQAHLTLTFQHLKPAMLIAENNIYCGRIKVLDIGLSAQKAAALDTPYFFTEAADVRQMLQERPAFGHKGTFGHALLVCGRYGMAGAAILSAKACLKSGVGKVTIHTPKRNNDLLQISVPEALLSHDADDAIFTTPNLSDAFSAIALGPAIGTDKRTALAFIQQTGHAAVPLVIDADGINILADHRSWIRQIPKGTVFTPHLGEMSRLGLHSTDHFAALEEAKEMAVTHGFFIILKNRYTAVCTPQGKVYFNPTGNNALATAGSGDVLTGMLAALLAEGYETAAACRLAVFLHGLAGDLAATDLGQESVTASDLIDYLPKAFRALHGGEALPQFGPIEF